MVRTSLARLEQLDIGDQALYFGRIDRLPEPGPSRDGSGDPAFGESFHIGRLAVSGEDHEPLVVDWRARSPSPSTGPPASIPRAWPAAGTWRAWPDVLGIEDEYFVDPDGTPATLPRTGRRDGAAAGGERLLSDGMVLGARARCSPRWARPARGTWATSSGPSSASRTRSSARRLPASCRPGRSGNGQDRGGPAPRRLPPLHPPLPARAPRRARRRAQSAVPALHRAGAPLARRDRGQPLDGVGSGPRGARPRRRRPCRRPN